MSTYYYWQCLSHQPPLRAEAESGQHDYDLTQMREDFKYRQLLAEAAGLDYFSDDRYVRNTQRFFHQHPHCKLEIVDEYGDAHTTNGKLE